MSKQYNKFYHNDIKKQLGIDQSRSASQKLLDKVIKVDKRADFYSSQNADIKEFNSEARKKVKPNTQGQNQKQLTNLQILENKLMKNIQNQQNITKLLKSLTILKKCFNQQAFLNDPEINFINNWKAYSDQLINQITERNYCSSQSFGIMNLLADCVEILTKKFMRIGKQEQQEEGQLKDGNKEGEASFFLEEQVWVAFCRLFTDDSFIFHKNLSKLKSFIFSTFDNSSQSTQQNKSLATSLINKLVLIPIKIDWMHTSLVNFFKQFNNQGYQNQFSNDMQRKSYLKSYNDLLNRKPKSTGSFSSYNIMGSATETTGVRTVHLQATIQSSSDKWVSKQ